MSEVFFLCRKNQPKFLRQLNISSYLVRIFLIGKVIFFLGSLIKEMAMVLGVLHSVKNEIHNFEFKSKDPVSDL